MLINVSPRLSSLFEMNIQFLIAAKEEGHIPQSEKRKFNEDLNVLSKHAKSSGLSVNSQKALIDVALNLDLDDRTFQNLLLCMIPKKVITKEIVDHVLLWLLVHYTDYLYEKKVSWLLDWIACLLDHKMIDKEALDQYYSLLFVTIKKNWKSASYILYLLTKPEDVTKWRINLIEDFKAVFLDPPHLCVLLKRFKELNPNFVYQTVRVRKTIEQVFCDKNKFYEHIRESRSRRSVPISSSMSIMPYMNHKKLINNTQDIILPPVQYLQRDNQPQIFGECHIDDISNGSDLIKNFHKLTLPLNTLSLLNSSTGIYVLMMSSRPAQEHFFQNLRCLLEENLISKRSNYSISEVENLLENIIRLQQIYNQGFTAVSRVFSVFLQFWDGHQYRPQVFKILEWFTFKSHIELNKFLLLPLHTLCVTSEPEDQCDIILYFLNLIQNMYSRLNKAMQNYKNIFEEPNVLHSREDLISVIKSLTKFTCELCKLALYIYPCNNQILLISLMFYEKIQELEVQYGIHSWTVISYNVVYHCLFSFNAELVNQMCGLWLRYRQVAQLLSNNSAVKVEDKKERLSQFSNDMFNILWTGQSFAGRSDGHVFTGLSSADQLSWRQYVNLDNSLTLEKHIMFSPHRMLYSGRINKPWNSLSKEDMLDVLKEHFPYLHDVLESMVLNADIEDHEDSE